MTVTEKTYFPGVPDYLPLNTHEAAQLTDYDRVYIAKLCRLGYIKATRKRNRWYILPRDLREFMDTHKKYTGFDTDRPKVEGGDIVEFEDDVEQLDEGDVSDLWTKTEVRMEGATLRDMRTWGRTRRGLSRITTKLAEQLRPLQPGESVRLLCTSRDKAIKIQSYVREAAQLAGWYETVSNPDDWKKWVFWVSHTEPCVDGEGCYLQIARLREGKPAKSHAKKKATMRIEGEGWLKDAPTD